MYNVGYLTKSDAYNIFCLTNMDLHSHCVQNVTLQSFGVTFYYAFVCFSVDFSLMTVVIIAVGVVFLPVTLLLSVAICHEGGKKCTRKQRINGMHLQ